MSLAIPGARNVYQDQALTTVAESYIPDPSVYIADMAFPPVSVDTPTGIYYSWSLGDLARVGVTQAREGTEAAEIVLPNTKLPYNVEDPFAAKIPVEYEERQKADFDILSQKTMFLMDQMYENREIEFGQLVDVDGEWMADETLTAKWDAAGDPIADVTKARVAIHGATGFVPNTIVTSFAVTEALRNNEAIRERLRNYANRGVLFTGNDDLSAIFKMRFLSSAAIYNAAKRGRPDDIRSILGKSLLVMHTTTTPSRTMPSAGYCFYDADYAGGGAQSRITRWSQDDPERDWIRAQQRFNYHKIASNLGYRFKAVIA